MIIISKSFWFFSFLVLVNPSVCKVYEDVIQGTNQWYFLDKFVFDTTGNGVLKFGIQIQIDKNLLDSQGKCDMIFSSSGFNSSGIEGIDLRECQNYTMNSAQLLFYNDIKGTGNDWSTIYNDDSLSCEDRTGKASVAIPLYSDIFNANDGIVITPAAIPHFWHVAISSCRFRSFAAAVRLEFYNSGWDQKTLTYQFSFDDQGLCEMSIFFFLVYSLGSGAILYFVRSFILNNVMHEIHWMLLASYCSYWLSHMMNMIHQTRYSQDGKGVEALAVFSSCWEVVGYVIFINVLLLIARGWTITTNKLSRKSESMVISAFIVYIYTALFFGAALRDRAESSYLYDSWPGYLFIGMNMFLLILFNFLLQRTFVFEKRVVKRNFYKRFAFVFSAWFLQLPIFVLIAKGIPPYYQSKVLYGLQWAVQFLAFSIIPFLSRPKNALEIYSAENNFDSRIPSLARQMRVQPSAIELPASQGGRPQLPPVNRNMTTNLSEADAVAALNGDRNKPKNNLDHTLHGLVKDRGEGIRETD